jgi:hypothetical protein
MAGGTTTAVLVLLQQALEQAASTRGPAGQAAALVDLQLLVLAPSRGPLQASGRATGGGRAVCFCEAEAQGPDGRPVARAMATFRYQAVAPDSSPEKALR